MNLVSRRVNEQHEPLVPGLVLNETQGQHEHHLDGVLDQGVLTLSDPIQEGQGEEPFVGSVLGHFG